MIGPIVGKITKFEIRRRIIINIGVGADLRIRRPFSFQFTIDGRNETVFELNNG
jgi:hypothetical protein